jgi:hypothetical protein
VATDELRPLFKDILKIFPKRKVFKKFAYIPNEGKAMVTPFKNIEGYNDRGSYDE